MALTPSTMLELGTPAPAFSLPDTVSGNTFSNADVTDKPLLVMFLCTHCPFVKHVEGELAQLGQDYADKAHIIAIGSNDPAISPSDKPADLRAQAETLEFNFPYLFDKTQDVAKAFTAACTPDFFLFDAEHKLVYRGRLDESRPGNDKPVSGADLRAALEAVINDQPVTNEQYPSAGCNIKWRTPPS
ncbi:MAG: thioredoxin family protein, partial [Deinococcota bacterium]